MNLFQIKRFFLLMFSFVVLCSCSGEEQQEITSSEKSPLPAVKEAGQIFRSISEREAQAMIERNGSLLLLDVRTPQERNQVRVAGSQLVALGDVLRGKLALPQEQPVMLLCAVGGRSYVAAKVLSRMGYREVYNLDGGIEAWRRAGLPLEYGPEPGAEKAPAAAEKQQ